MLTFLEEFPDYVSSLFRSSKNIIILGDFNIPWNKPENPDTTNMQEIMDIYTQTHKLGNTLDWLISNTPKTIQDITKKDYLSDHSIIEWKLQISRKDTIIKKRPNQNQWGKLQCWPEEEPGNRHDKKHSNKIITTTCMSLKRKWKNMHHWSPRWKPKKNHNPWFNKDSQKLKLQWRMTEKRWIESKQHQDLLDYNISTQYIRSTYITPRKHTYHPN